MVIPMNQNIEGYVYFNSFNKIIYDYAVRLGFRTVSCICSTINEQKDQSVYISPHV
jgi:hypothetical protein